MKQTDFAILSLFKGNSSQELSTTDLVSNLYSEEYLSLQETISNDYASKESVLQAKERISKLHRRVLHHTSSLIKEGAIVVSRIEGKGKKYYSLALGDGEELEVDSRKRKIIITRPSKPTLPLQDLIERDVTHLVERDYFFEKVNAILLNPRRFSTTEALYEYILSIFSQINDVVAINDFEHIILEHSLEDVDYMLSKLHSEAQAYNKRVCLVIDFSNIAQPEKIISFCKLHFKESKDSLIYVFDATSRELLEQNDLVEFLIEMYAEKRMKLNIKNDDLYNAPYFLGKSGPYAVSTKDWKDCIKHGDYKNRGFVTTQSSIVFDLANFRSYSSSAKSLSEALLQVSKALFFSNTYQRKYSLELHKKMNPDGIQRLSPIFSYSKNYIRFWNYQVDDQNLVIETLNECKKDIDDFTKMQETIYLSCGMPTRFDIGFAVAYRQSMDRGYLKPKFETISVSCLQDLYEKSMKERLTFFEKASKLFQDGFEVRFHRIGTIEVLDVLQEISFIMNSYKIPFFCYQFTQSVGANKKLDFYIR